MSYRLIAITVLIVGILCAGCIGSTQDPPAAKTNTDWLKPIQTPTYEATFISPAGSGKTPVPTKVPVSTSTPAKNDPIIGTWTLENAPYSGTVIFFEGGTGSLSVGLSMVSTKKQFAWSNIENNDDSRVYHITLAESDMITNGTMYENGTIFSNALPDNSYLRRYR